MLTACVSPENGLTKYAREAGVTERMTQDAPRLARLLPAVDAYLGENAPLILFRADELAFLSAAGSEAVCMKRPVYDVRTLTAARLSRLQTPSARRSNSSPPWPTQRMRPSPAACSSAASQTACCI